MDDFEVTIDGEHTAPRGWIYTFHTQWGDGQVSHHEMALSWVDHEHLVGGSVSPSFLAKHAAHAAVEYFKRDLPTRFDVSSLMRRIPDFEKKMQDPESQF